MAFPAGASTITLTGTFPVPVGGTARDGEVILTPTAVLVDSTQHAIYSGGGPVALDSTGHFSVLLLCNDDTDIQPTGWRWRVDERPAGGVRRTPYYIDLPAALGPSIDLSALAPVSAPDGSGQSLPPTGAAGGALTGSYPNPQLSAATTASFDPAGAASAAQTAATGYTDSVAATKAALAHAARHAAGGGDPVTLTQAQITGLAAALATLAPLTGATFTGPVIVDDSNFSVLGTNKGYRFRPNGARLDCEATGSDWIFSVFPGAAFDGAQRTYLRLESGVTLAHACGTWVFADTPDSGAVHTIDGSGNKLGFYGATAAAKPTVTGAKGGNAALASLITALATLGLITDNTTA